MHMHTTAGKECVSNAILVLFGWLGEQQTHSLTAIHLQVKKGGPSGTDCSTEFVCLLAC